jgi:HEAT repeat protein
MNAPGVLEDIRKAFKEYPTLAPRAALVLARAGDWEAAQFLRNRLSRREDPTDANLVYRAEAAAALLANGDPSTLAVFQEILRSDSAKAKQRVFELFVDTGNVRLIPILQPTIENVDRRMSLDACEAVAALASPPFRARIQEMRPEE